MNFCRQCASNIKTDFIYEELQSVGEKVHGVCIVFNYENFSTHQNLPTRSGTEKDVFELKQIFPKLHFDMRIYENLTTHQTLQVLHKDFKSLLPTLFYAESSVDHSTHESLICIILSHGNNESFYTYDSFLPMHNVVQSFLPPNCPSLAKKPKIFFVQTCRGVKFDLGISHEATDSNKIQNCYRMPLTADVLIVYSTVEGYVSWRNVEKGSWFIQELVSVLNLLDRRNAFHEEDIESICIHVARNIAMHYESEDGCKQMISRISTLTKRYFFK